MSFADDVKKNYRPISKPTTNPDLCSKLAEKKYIQAKEQLMSLSESGSSKEKHLGIGIIKTRVVETSIGVFIDKRNTNPFIPTFDGDECMSIATTNNAEYNKVIDTIRKLCTKDKISLRVEKSNNLAHDKSCTLWLWVKV